MNQPKVEVKLTSRRTLPHLPVSVTRGLQLCGCLVQNILSSQSALEQSEEHGIIDDLSFQKLLQLLQEELDFDPDGERIYWETAGTRSRIHNDVSLRFAVTMVWQTGEKVIRFAIDEARTGI